MIKIAGAYTLLLWMVVETDLTEEFMADKKNKAVPYSALEGERPEISINMLQDGSDEQVSIIVVHRDRPEYLNICLQSIAGYKFEQQL